MGRMWRKGCGEEWELRALTVCLALQALFIYRHPAWLRSRPTVRDEKVRFVLRHQNHLGSMLTTQMPRSHLKTVDQGRPGGSVG